MIFLGECASEQQLMTYQQKYPDREAYVIEKNADNCFQGTTIFVGSAVAIEHFTWRDRSGYGFEGGDVYFPLFYPSNYARYGFGPGDRVYVL